MSIIVMSLEDTVSKIGHYAKNTWNAVKRPLAYVSAAAIILTTFNANELRAEGDDAYANGIILTKNAEDSSRVGEATVYLRPESMAMYVPDTTYTFVTNSNGLVEFDSVWVYVDSTTNIDTYVQDNTRVLPNFGSDINVFLPQDTKGVLQYITLNGQVAKQKEFSGDNVHMDLSDVAAGIGIYRVILDDGTAIAGKYVKMNVPSKGASARPAESNFKNIELTYEATYWMIWEKEGFIKDSTLITLHDGENYPLFAYMQPVDSTIDNLDLEGYVWKLENTNNTLENAQVKVTVDSNGDEYTATSDSDGHFVVNGLPLGEAITFDIGGITGRYSFTGINFITPEEIINPADSINSEFSAVLPLKLASSSAEHIDDMNASGTNQDTIWFYLGNSFSGFQKNTIRNYFTNFQSDENNSYIFAEKFTASNIGINIEYGTYNTNPSEETIQTPLGETLYPVAYANSTMGVGNYFAFVHEIKRALGLSEVAWPEVESVMEATVQDYTLEDKEIAEFVARPYEIALYGEGKTWIKIDNISEDMNSKSPNSNISNTNLENYESSNSFRQ